MSSQLDRAIDAIISGFTAGSAPASPSYALPGSVTPVAGTASTIVTGGTAITVANGPCNGGYVLNPPTLTAQNIAEAEDAFVDPVAAPGSTAAAANGTTTMLPPGAVYAIPALAAGSSLRANAATSGHKLTVVVWALLIALFCSGAAHAQSAGNKADAVAGLGTGLTPTQAYPYVWNGTTWDRLRGDATNGAFVNLKSSITLTVTGAGGTFPITNAALGLAQGSTTSGQTGILPLGAVTTAAPSYTTAQSSPFSLTTGGGLRADLTTIAGTAPVTGGAAGILGVGGTVATNVAITDNPINNGAQAVSSENSAVTTARKVQLVADLVGKLIVLPYANPENFVHGVTAAITDTTSTPIIASAGGSLRNYITSCKITNSHATVGTFVKIVDGASATLMDEGYAAPAGGGWSTTYGVPIPGTAATAVNCQAVTTGANFICSCQGYKGV